ncbi:YncE family protein [Sphingobium estronivorans]|uniref:YncE family protein n=1 Tax=Sphingobium estronivorans TaxID=1577690 RepID=UPI00123BFAC8|nr:gluconolactonase [Sphingobium estronivorans]
MRRLIFSLLAASVAIASAPAAFAGSAPAFVRAADIPAPDGRWDFASWDSEHGHLLVAHGQDVLLVDPALKPVFRTIGKIEGAHAALAIPGTNRILVTSGHDDSVRILDAGSGAQIASIAVPADPDAAIVSADGHMAYVMAAKAGMVSVIDLDSLRELRRFPLKPGLEVPVLVDSHLLAVNNEDAGEIELVDPDAGKALGAIALPGCEGPTGMAYSPETGLALSACANGKAALVDLAEHKLVRLVPIGLGPDTAIWQAKERRFLVPCGKIRHLVGYRPQYSRRSSRHGHSDRTERAHRSA